MFAIEKRKLKVIFRLCVMPSSHDFSHGQIEQHRRDGRDQLVVSFRTEPCQQVGAYVKPDAKQNIASVQKGSGRTCGENLAMGEKFSATDCVRK